MRRLQARGHLPRRLEMRDLRADRTAFRKRRKLFFQKREFVLKMKLRSRGVLCRGFKPPTNPVYRKENLILFVTERTARFLCFKKQPREIIEIPWGCLVLSEFKLYRT